MKSSAQLQREATAQRAHLSSTLDQLGDSMTAKQISTEMLSLAKDSGVSIVRSLAHTARDNPVAALLIGAGLMMMLTKGDDDKEGSGLVGKAGGLLKDAMSAGTSAVKGAASSVGKAASSVADTAKDVVGAARDSVENAANSARKAADSGLDKADGLADRGKEQAKHLLDGAQDLASKSKSALEKLADEQPILLAAAGAVLGAALGAALPVSAAERRYFGEASSKVVRAGRDTAARVADVVKKETLGDHPETKLAAVAEKAIRSVTQDIKGESKAANQSGGV